MISWHADTDNQRERVMGIKAEDKITTQLMRQIVACMLGHSIPHTKSVVLKENFVSSCSTWYHNGQECNKLVDLEIGYQLI